MAKPREISVGSDRYNATVLMVTQRDHMGRPLVLRVVHDGAVVDLQELGADANPPEFVVAYFNRDTWGAG